MKNEILLYSETAEAARNGSTCQLTKNYSVCEGGKKSLTSPSIGGHYINAPIWSCDELFVPDKFRHRGIGARILAEVEKLPHDVPVRGRSLVE